MGISVSSNGSFTKTYASLQRLAKVDISAVMESCGQQGMAALASGTPTESGLAANSWRYDVTGGPSSCTITWYNTDVESGFPVAIMLQYGYSTGTGGYVQGRDYINPAIKPVFDAIEAKIWKVVTSS